VIAGAPRRSAGASEEGRAVAGGPPQRPAAGASFGRAVSGASPQRPAAGASVGRAVIAGAPRRSAGASEEGRAVAGGPPQRPAAGASVGRLPAGWLLGRAAAGGPRLLAGGLLGRAVTAGGGRRLLARPRRGLVGLAVALSFALAGCYQEVRIDDPDGSPLPWDGGAADGSPGRFVPPSGECVEGTGVDLLLVVDNSNSMAEEQASLAAELPSLVRSLVEPPDADADGQPDWVPIPDLRVGVVTTDMGTGGFAVTTCVRSDFGDDGVLRTAGNPGLTGCMATYPPFLQFEPSGGTPAEAFAADVSCVATVGTGGCGFEQPLEAALKALSPAAPTASTGPGYVPPRFFRDTRGHGDGANDGFVRDDSLLAVVVVTDEEDCSALDPTFFDPSSPTYGATDLNLRCSVHAAEALHPVSRYVEGLAALRAGRPDLLAFALIAGVPPDLASPEPTDEAYAAILADERMQERIDPAMPTRLVPSCNVPGRGVAFPPRRLVEVARGLGAARSTVQSICQADFSPAAGAIARLVGTRACRRYEE
jgi:hypothetical protein